jgi:hypothetical protein
MTFLMTYAFLRTLTRGNHCACLVEAVGIEPSPEDLGLHDSGAIARKGADRKTSLKRSESGLTALLGTRVPGSDSIDAILAHARLAWGAMRVI